MRVTPFWPLLLVLACDSKTTPSKDAAPATGTPPPATVTVSAKPSASTATAPTASAPPPLPSDAGAPCPVLSGPSQLPFTGPVALVARGDGVDLVFAADGGPKLLHSDLGAAPPPLPPSGAAKAQTPGCAAAGMFAFCMNASGAITRHGLGGAIDLPVGKGKPGSRLGAVAVGAETAVAFLAERTTSEGLTSEAWLVGQSTPLTRISDDGAGATFVTLASTGPDSMVALYIDGRRGMAPIHGVRFSLRGGKLVRDKDDVLYVAGGAETWTGGAIATSSSDAFALVPIAHDVGFGLLVSRFGATGDEHWSDYDNGLDPAPIAATALGPGDPWAIRVRPDGKKPFAPRVAELGRVTAAGFVPSGILPTHGDPSSVAIARDPGHALVVAFTDATGTWLERLRCP